MLYFEIIFATLIAYLFGSISSAIVVCKLMRLPDPRTQGSKNPGATNVLRIGGKKAAAITLLGDVLKGIIPILLAKYLGLNAVGLSLVAFAAFIGHLFPIFFGFEGGKGVATLLGCLLALSWPVAVAWMVTWLVVAFIFRYSSLAALTASWLTPFFFWFFTKNTDFVIVSTIMLIFLTYRHQSNILKLFSGQESKIGKRVKL
ncbi:MAG: glycerol-3-phosphate 1-O-acyltransferase PlsY [Gammaproteobacteria bacterium]|nr:glycerol-3-phosphate 1-O-acyltransferase PlsY [Gammaproteobacteria bacterium]